MDGPSQWTVESTGRRTWYSEALVPARQRYEALSGVGGRAEPEAALSWHVSRVEDPHGNAMTVDYGNRAAGLTVRPYEIQYTAAPGLTADRVVRFVYRQSSDVRTVYAFGVSDVLNELVQEIQMFGPNAAGARSLLWSYRLTYCPRNSATSMETAETISSSTPSPASHRFRLATDDGFEWYPSADLARRDHPFRRDVIAETAARDRSEAT